MPRRAFISTLGMYYANPNLFADMSMPQYTYTIPDPDDPDAPPVEVTADYLDKDNFIYNLLMETAELEVIYPDAEFFQEAIKQWSLARLNVWERVALVLMNKYDPFINIRRHEERNIIQDRDLASGATNTYNQNAWNDSSSTGVQTNVNVSSGTDTGSVTTTETFDLEGDSAITDAQDVARKEVELRTEYDLMKYMINDFKKRFCLLVY